MSTPQEPIKLTTIYDTKSELRHDTKAEPQGVTRPEFLRTYGYRSTEIHDWSLNIQTNVRQRMRLWLHHILWVCKNIVNMDSVKLRKDIVGLTNKDVARLKEYSAQMIQQIDTLKLDVATSYRKSNINEILRLLHVLEGVMVREYITPVLTVGYVQHLQVIGKSFTTAHWALTQPETDALKMDEVSEYIILLYHIMVMILKFIDVDVHNAVYYQCMGLIQKYHSLSRTATSVEAFYTNYTALVQSIKDLLDVFQQVAQYSNSFYIPRTIISLWQQDTQLVLRMLDLYAH
jgi:hypothetical protein